MLKNYLKIALRNLMKNKFFSIINIVGLAFGLCCALIIGLWIHDETSVDFFHTKGDRIFWVISEFNPSSGSMFISNTPAPLADKLENDIAGIEEAVRFSNGRGLLFIQDHQSIEEVGIFADPQFLEVLDYPLKQGDKSTALTDPYSVVISDKMAAKLFPNSDALNKTINIDYWGRRDSYKVTGVLEKMSFKSVLDFEFILPYERHLKVEPWIAQWGNYNDRTIVLLEDEADKIAISSQVTELINNNSDDVNTILHLYPFDEVYLYSDFKNGLKAEGKIKYVRIFFIIGVIIVLIACINFMNMSTARAGKRAKEVGIRKATGADRSSLIFQFLGESIAIAYISGLLAITMADLLMPYFNDLTEKSISINYSSPIFILTFIGLCTISGFLAGIYPALYLSKFNPSRVLKGTFNGPKSLSGFRRILVVFQFSISIIFIITTIVVYNQFEYVLNKDLGVNKENILTHHLNSIIGSRESYKEELLQIPGVRSVTNAGHSPLNASSFTIDVNWSGKAETDEIQFNVIQSDNSYLNTFGLQLLEGKDFSNQYDTAKLEVILNEQAVKTIGLTEPIGSRLKLWGDEVEVVGIVKDFHHSTLDKSIGPVIINHANSDIWRCFISIDGDISKTKESIQQVYSKREKNYPFDYSFVDKDYARAYKDLSIMGQLSSIFAVVAIVVSCLGLFGLASYLTEQRKKETGIRKVLGASAFGLVTMFSKNFLILVIISFVISVPVAWYFSSSFLDEFTFKITLGISPFMIGGVSALLVALATVSYHTIRAAIANPVESLKYE